VPVSGRAKGLPPANLTVVAALEALRSVPREVPLVAFGQSPFWDEPMKAIVAAAADRPVIAGIHDLDYFSRLRALLPGPEWQIVSRNDGSLRDAWVAAGELSVPFGTEEGVTRQALTEAGVRLQSLLPDDPRRRLVALDRATATWGWRGIVHNVAQPAVVCDVPAGKAAPMLRELLDWGFRETARLMGTASIRAAVRECRRELLGWLDDILADPSNASLADLHMEILRRLYRRLLGSLPEHVTFTTTRDYFRFTPETATRPRFGLLARFLDPDTASVVRRAYDEAIADTPTVTLRSLGPHATPFDVYAPGRGRGTLHLAADEVRIGFPKPVTLAWPAGRRDLPALARELKGRLGPDISVVGKAVVLPLMFCGEAIMLLTETASAYMPRTHRMLSALAGAGLAPDLHPILRVRLRTWDSLRACSLEIRLPPHLARAFRRKSVDSEGFSRRWKRVVRTQRTRLRRLARILGPCEFIEYLGEAEHETWFRRLEACQRANAVLLEVQRTLDALRRRAADLRVREDALADEISAIERRRGDLNRQLIRPLKRRLASLADDARADERKSLEAEYQRAVKEGQALLSALAAKREERRRCTAERRALGRRIRAAERGRKASAARQLLRRVFRQGERARLRLARDALLTVNGLHRGDARPSAWWTLALDPSGAWFERIRRTTRCRLEQLGEEGS